MNHEIILQKNIDSVYEEINALIQQKKGNVKKVVNDAMISLYWEKDDRRNYRRT